jgi:hypothetical protein
MGTLFQKPLQASNTNGRAPSVEIPDLPREGEVLASEHWRISLAPDALTLTHLIAPSSDQIRIREFFFHELRLATASPKTKAAALRLVGAVAHNATMEQMIELAGVLAAVSGASIECRSVPSERFHCAT